MPSEVIVTVPITDDLTTRLIEPCVRYLAENSDTMIDLDGSGRLRAGVEFDVGLSHIVFDVEETMIECLDMEDLPLAIIAMERMMETLRGMLPSDPDERKTLRPSKYDQLPQEEQAAIDRALGLEKEKQ